jgi:hypothetical protein
MSAPFIIWTMQRTGGTSLTDLLMEMSEHRTTEHEPFNWREKKPGPFWPIARAWNNTGDVAAISASLDKIFADRHLIKHCYELHNMRFNEQLLAAAIRAGYRHVLLLRRDEFQRLISRFIAEAQGTWFKDYSRKVFSQVVQGKRVLGPLPVNKVVGHFRRCRSITSVLLGWFKAQSVEYCHVYYEDLYTGEPATRLASLHTLLEFLQFSEDDITGQEALIKEKIFLSGQDTGSVLPFVPNLDVVRQALEAAGCGSTDEHAIDEVPERNTAVKPIVRMAAEFRKLVEAQETQGPYLQIGVSDPGDSVLVGERFAGEARHILALQPKVDLPDSDLTQHQGEVTDMSGLFPDGMFNTVVWDDALVHERFFWRALNEIWRILAPGGTLILAVPGFSKAPKAAGVTTVKSNGMVISNTTPTYRIHSTPDFWRISPQAMRQVVLHGYDIRQIRISSMPPRIFGVGIKPSNGQPVAPEVAL